MAGRRGFKPPRDYDPRRGKGGAVARRPSSPSAKSKQASVDDQTKRKHAGQPRPRAEQRPQTQKSALQLRPTITHEREVSGLRFEDLGLGQNIVKALGELGAAEPFAIQAVTIPDVVAGKDLLGRASTGSGKTIAFGAGLVERLLRLKAEGAFAGEAPRGKLKRGERAERSAAHRVRAPKALILAPTRELALQIDRTVQPIARSVGFFTGQFVGGQPFEPQVHALKRGVDIAIGTPGRIEDLARRGHLMLGQVHITVIDEADHMAELGFIEPVQRILRQTLPSGQRLLYSATLDRGVDEVVLEFMPNPAMHEVVGAGAAIGRAAAETPFSSEFSSETGLGSSANVEHRVLIVLREHKADALVQLAREGGRTVVFCRTRDYTDQVTDLLGEAGLRAVPLHGNLSQARRERNLEKFTTGRADVLVATDVAARGIHVDDIDLVLQADPPDDAKTYVHRAGRTGRVGRAGRVITVIPRTRQKRTRELFEQLGFEPSYFGDFEPA